MTKPPAKPVGWVVRATAANSSGWRPTSRFYAAVFSDAAEAERAVRKFIPDATAYVRAVGRLSMGTVEALELKDGRVRPFRSSAKAKATGSTMGKHKQFRIISQGSSGIKVTTKQTAKEAAEVAAHELLVGSEVHVEDEAGNTITSDQLAGLIKRETSVSETETE